MNSRPVSSWKSHSPLPPDLHLNPQPKLALPLHPLRLFQKSNLPSDSIVPLFKHPTALRMVHSYPSQLPRTHFLQCPVYPRPPHLHRAQPSQHSLTGDEFISIHLNCQASCPTPHPQTWCSGPLHNSIYTSEIPSIPL